MVYHNSLLFVFLMVVTVGLPCVANDGAVAPLVANDILREAGLGQAWQVKLALKEGERVEKLMLLGDNVYALTSDNYLFAVNRTTGEPAFGQQLATAGFPVLEPQLCENKLVVVAGNRILQIDTSLGTIARTQVVDYTVVCPAVQNDTYFYVAETGRRVHAIGLASNALSFEAAAGNDSMPTSLAATNDDVVFTTDKGNVVSVSATEPKRLWQFDAADTITAQIVRDNNDVYAASWDTNLYRLNASTGKRIWQYQLGGKLKHAPSVTSSRVYQYVAGRGVTAIDKQTGLPLWTADDGVGLLAQMSGRTYLITDKQTIGVIDNATHKRLYTINVAKASLYAANTIDGKIYVADKMGRVACIAAAK